MSIEAIFSVYSRSARRHPRIFILLLIVYIGFFSIYFYRRVSGLKSTDKAPIPAMAAKEITSILDTEKDIERLSEKALIIFNSYDRKSKGELSEYGFVSFLEDLYATQPDVISDSNKSASVISLIAKQKEKDPYYGLRFEQKLVIKNLERQTCTLNGTNNFDMISEIKEIVRRQNSEIDELKKNNSLGIPIGLAGVLLTALFGVVSIYPFLRKRNLTNGNNQLPTSE